MLMINLEVEMDVEPLIQRLSGISEEGKLETVRALEKAAEMVRDEAKALCPVDTGSLQRSIRTFKREVGEVLCGFGVSAGGYVINPKTRRTVNYATFVEYGTSRLAAKPFLRPAFATMKPLIIALAIEAWRKVMEAGSHA
jgi:HK97 gp10 family phage protein